MGRQIDSQRAEQIDQGTGEEVVVLGEGDNAQADDHAKDQQVTPSLRVRCAINAPPTV